MGGDAGKFLGIAFANVPGALLPDTYSSLLSYAPMEDMRNQKCMSFSNPFYLRFNHSELYKRLIERQLEVRRCHHRERGKE